MTRTRRRWLRLALMLMYLLRFQTNAEKQKRQIFREQVLPARGGKIPDDAFRSDRLALNRLNKEGITVPDGIVLDARRIHKHPHILQSTPELIKVYLTPDGRYVPPEGRHHCNHPKAVDTTYVIRAPVGPEGSLRFRNDYNGYRSLGSVNPQNHARYQQFRPTPQIYKPVIKPLLLSTRENLLQQPYYPSWSSDFSWDTIYEPFDDYFINNVAFFNSHQIIADREGFFNEFHKRSLRHILSNVEGKSLRKSSEGFEPVSRTPPMIWQPSYLEKKAGKEIIFLPGPATGYPELSRIPETGFSCAEKEGMFADVETNCQTYHRCSGGRKTSSVCPPGTAFSDTKKRCERWNTVTCNE